MKPEDLIDESQILTQSNHTLIDIPFNIHNSEMNTLATYYDYRKMGVKCGKPLNPLEKLACDILERHAKRLYERRLWGRIWKRKN